MVGRQAEAKDFIWSIRSPGHVVIVWVLLCGVTLCVWTAIKTDESLFAVSGSSDSVTACGGHDWMGGKVKIGAVGKIKGSGISPEAFFHPTNSTAHNGQKMSQATGTCKHSRQSEVKTR